MLEDAGVSQLCKANVLKNYLLESSLPETFTKGKLTPSLVHKKLYNYIIWTVCNFNFKSYKTIGNYNLIVHM